MSHDLTWFNRWLNRPGRVEPFIERLRHGQVTPGWIGDKLGHPLALRYDWKFDRWCDRPKAAKRLYWRLHA